MKVVYRFQPSRMNASRICSQDVYLILSPPQMLIKPRNCEPTSLALSINFFISSPVAKSLWKGIPKGLTNQVQYVCPMRFISRHSFSAMRLFSTMCLLFRIVFDLPSSGQAGQFPVTGYNPFGLCVESFVSRNGIKHCDLFDYVIVLLALIEDVVHLAKIPYYHNLWIAEQFRLAFQPIADFIVRHRFFSLKVGLPQS